jgi:hypothetical protein
MILQSILIKKIQYKIKDIIIFRFLLNTWLYFFLYKSYWHYLLFPKNKLEKKIKRSYLSINVNFGARIGHQFANYNAAIFYAKKLDLTHIHTEFPDKKWEKTLDINFNCISSESLIETGFKKIQLPRFKENNISEISKIKKIIQSYCKKKVVFFLETDQPYTNQYEVASILQQKFFSSPQRKKEKLIYKKSNFNISVHVRMGDILQNAKIRKQRFLDIDYFINAINKSLSIIKTKKKIVIHIFAEKNYKSFLKLKQFNNIQFCYNLNQYKTFLHFIYADLLITSKSSFSYKAALINRGIKLCPKQFWHKYPKNNKNWVLIDV